jgi:hypothetical protein
MNWSAFMQGLKVEILPSTFEENLDKSGFANPGGTWIFLLDDMHWSWCRLSRLWNRSFHSVMYVSGIAEYATETATHKAMDVSQNAAKVWISGPIFFFSPLMVNDFEKIFIFFSEWIKSSVEA